MGNSIGGNKKKTAKVMKIDGTSFRLKPPAQAGDVLRDHPGHDLLDADEVKRLSLRAQPLGPYQPLQPGKLYFLVELPKLPDHKAPRRAWSGALPYGSAKERLESLKLSRRSVSDLSVSSSAVIEEPEGGGSGTRVKMRLPKAEVARLVRESKNGAEAAEKIVELCMAKNYKSGPAPLMEKRKDQKRTRFMPLPEEMIIA